VQFDGPDFGSFGSEPGPPPKTKAPTPSWLRRVGAFGADLGFGQGRLATALTVALLLGLRLFLRFFLRLLLLLAWLRVLVGRLLPAIARFIILVVTRLVISRRFALRLAIFRTRRLTFIRAFAVARPFTSAGSFLPASPRLPSPRASCGDIFGSRYAAPPLSPRSRHVRRTRPAAPWLQSPDAHDSPTQTVACSGWPRVHVPSATLAEPYAARANTALPRPSAALRSAGTVEARVHIVYNDGPVVDIRHVMHVHVHHRAVVEECAASPLAATEAYAPYPKP